MAGISQFGLEMVGVFFAQSCY